MSYRYPFTPYPKSWYRVNVQNQKIWAFGREFKLESSANGELKLCDANNKKRFPAIKKNGYIFAFFDEQGEEPDFDVPEVFEFNHPNWQPPFSLFWRARVHIQEIVENAVDLSHFCVVHTYRDIPQLSQFAIDGKQFKISMHSRRYLLGQQGKVSMDIAYHGMGIVVAKVISFGGVELKVLLTMTPFDIELCDIYLGVAIKKTPSKIKNLILKWVIPRDVKKEFSRDIPVWTSKIYRSKPVLCGNEGNIIRIRKWASQFYS